MDATHSWQKVKILFPYWQQFLAISKECVVTLFSVWLGEKREYGNKNMEIVNAERALPPVSKDHYELKFFLDCQKSACIQQIKQFQQNELKLKIISSLLWRKNNK